MVICIIEVIMTDPLTGKELVQKSYEYIDKLTKECGKVLLDDYNKTHKKFQLGTLASETATNVVQWFEKRDRNIRLALESNSIVNPQPTQLIMKFKGSTKDADFTLDGSVGVFVVPGSEVNNHSTCFVKTLTIATDKNNFTKRKV